MGLATHGILFSTGVELGTLPSHTSSSKETAMTSVASSPPPHYVSHENGSEVTAFVNPEFDKVPFPSEDEVKPELEDTNP